MFNVTFIKIRDLIKFFIIAIIIYTLGNFILKTSLIKNLFDNSINIDTSKFIKLGINSESEIIKNISEKEANEKTEEVEEDIESIALKSILQIGEVAFKENTEEKDQQISDAVNVEIQEKENQETGQNEVVAEAVIESDTPVETEVITPNPIKENYNKEYNGVKIKNETSFELTTEMLDTNSLNINTDNIIVFHTHTCESYTQSEEYKYIASGNFRTTDLNYSVVRVGDELTKQLIQYGFNVNHNRDYHDYPSYTGSYTRSLSTVKNILQNFNSDIIIDLHRDAIGSKSDYAPTVRIGQDKCAQIMFVIGTNGGGLNHPNWNENLKFAVKVQEVANQIYPELFKPIILRDSRYNQHLGKAACIIEVGATGNTLDETINSMKYLSLALKKALTN